MSAMFAYSDGNNMMADVKNLFQKASKMHQKGRLAEAEKLYKKILVQTPDYSPVFNALGILAAQQGKLPAAVDFFNKAIKAIPNDLAPRENLARTWLTMGKYVLAQDAYSDVLNTNPKSYAALFGLGCALQSQKKYDKALSVFSNAQAINEKDPILYLNMGNSYQQLERQDDALLQYKKALALKPDSVDANVCLAHTLLQQQEYLSAEEYFSRAIELGAKRADVEFGYAQTLENKGEETAARKHYFNAVEMDPDSQNAYIQLDQFLLKSGGDDKKTFLKELASDYIYADWQESKSDMRKLASMSDYPDNAAVQALRAFVDDYDPSKLHSRRWWQKRLDTFGGMKNGHDKLLRSLHSAIYCWSLPDKQTLTELADFISGTRLCSYGAGAGVWECLMQQHFDIEVDASDINLRHRFLPMKQVDYSTAKVVPNDSIFFAWILRGDLNVLNILNQMHQGQKLVLIGEPPDEEDVPRICATPEMWSLLYEKFLLVKTIPLVSYSLLNDTACLFVKN